MNSTPISDTPSTPVPAMLLGAYDKPKMAADLVDMLYRNAVVSQPIVLVAAALVAIAVWSQAAPGWVLGWFLAMCAVTLTRIQFNRVYHRTPPAAARIAAWRNRFVAGSATTGAIWGAAGMFLTPQTDLATQFVVIFTLAGMVAAAVPTLASVPIAFHLFAVLVLAPLALQLLADPDASRATLGVLTVLYLAGMVELVRRTHKNLRATLALRQQNRALVAYLTQANTDAEAVNAKLEAEVGAHRHAKTELERSLSLLRATLESTTDGIAVVDLQGRLVSYNQRFVNMFRIPIEVLRAGTVEALIESFREQLIDAGGFVARTRVLYAAHETESHDTLAFKDGRVYERFSMPQRIAGRCVGRVCSFRDITERKVAEEQLNLVANYDSLTQLPNRTLFARRLAEALARARRHQSQAAVMIIDLDRFKIINDTLGHDAGDRLLAEAATRLTQCLRETDTVARLGGDEFVVLAEDLQDAVTLTHVAQRVLGALAGPYDLKGQEVHLTASVGVSTYPNDSDDAASLLKHADIAMYRAKEKGKNAVEFFADTLNVHTVERLALESKLIHATERDELVLHYQPKIELATRRVVGVEALVRWNHPDLGFVRPDQFIPIAEETGLIVPIGEWVLRTACEQHKRWVAQGLEPLRVAVNLSGRQFGQSDLLARIVAILRETGVDGDQLEIELTESMMMRNADRAVEVIEALRAQRIHLAIDDFGTGYSSLGYLKRFPVDCVKIDRSFVRDLPHAPGDCAIAQAVIAMAHALELKAVAEGVETIEQLEFLQRHGCDQVQGYYFAKPLTADAFARFIVDYEERRAQLRAA